MNEAHVSLANLVHMLLINAIGYTSTYVWTDGIDIIGSYVMWVI